MMSKDTKIQTKIMIVLLPVMVLVAAYFFLFYGQDEQQSSRPKGSGIAFLEPEAETKELGTKSEIYDQEKMSALEKEQIIKKSSLDDLFNEEVQKELEKDASTDIPDSWLTGDNKEKKEESKPSVSGNSKPSGSQSVNPIYSSKPRQSPATKEQKPQTQPITQNTAEKTTKRKFYSIDSQTEEVVETNSSSTVENVPCVVASDHNLRSGQTIRMRISESFVLNGKRIPKNTMISGIATFANERVDVLVQSIKVFDEIIPCKLHIYDYDGVEGIYIPSGVNQEIAKNGVGQGISISARLPVVGSISTSSGQKKLQDPTVTVPAGYKIYLRSMVE